MPATDPERSILDKNDDDRRFLLERFAEVNTTPVPKTGTALFQTTREHQRFTEFADTVRAPPLHRPLLGATRCGKNLVGPALPRHRHRRLGPMANHL